MPSPEMESQMILTIVIHLCSISGHAINYANITSSISPLPSYYTPTTNNIGTTCHYLVSLHTNQVTLNDHDPRPNNLVLSAESYDFHQRSHKAKLLPSKFPRCNTIGHQHHCPQTQVKMTIMVQQRPPKLSLNNIPSSV
eukprot:7484412-Ditylum_brightwellii.AAC.1